MTNYLLQLITDDFEEQLSTEVLAASIPDLQVKSKEMVKNNANVVGCVYRIFKIIKQQNGSFNSLMLKQDVILG